MKKKRKKKVARGPWEYNYNMTHEVAVSRLSLKWRAFYIRFLQKIPFHSYTNKSVPCSTASALCIYLLWWLMKSVPLPFFFQDLSTWWVKISWNAIEVNVTADANIRANIWLRSAASMMENFFFSFLQRYWFQHVSNSAARLTARVAQIGNCFSNRSKIAWWTLTRCKYAAKETYEHHFTASLLGFF